MLIEYVLPKLKAIATDARKKKPRKSPYSQKRANFLAIIKRMEKRLNRPLALREVMDSNDPEIIEITTTVSRSTIHEWLNDDELRWW